MSWLDGVTLLLLSLVALGGYGQGCIRGVVHLVALALIGMFGLFLLRFVEQPTVTSSIIWAVGGVVTTTIVVGAAAWLLLRSFGPRVHLQSWNRALGVMPALGEGLLVVGLILAAAERLAPSEAVQLLIREGAITRLLIAPFDLIELWLIRQ